MQFLTFGINTEVPDFLKWEADIRIFWGHSVLNNLISHPFPITGYTKPGSPHLWDLMPNDLRWSWCNKNRNKMHNRCNKAESSPRHPTSWWKNSSFMKPVPYAKMVGGHWAMWHWWRLLPVSLPWPALWDPPGSMSLGEIAKWWGDSCTLQHKNFKRLPKVLNYSFQT